MSTQQLIQSKSVKDILATDAVKARFREILGDRGPQLSAAVIQLVSQSNQLQKCDPNSIIGCALMSAALDLSIDPNLGESAVVPYGTKAQFQVMYGGYTQLALRSGQYKTLGWKVVHTGELDVWDELSGELEVNSLHPEAEVIGYAAKFKLLNGFEKGLYWGVNQCFDHAERFSKAYRAGKADESKQEYSLWFTNPDRACLKTVLKMLLKLWGPKSIQMQKALKVDEGAIVNAETGEVEYLDATNATEVSRPEFETVPETSKAAACEPAKPSKSKEAVPEPKESEKSATVTQDSPLVNKVKLLSGYIKLAGLQDAEVCNYAKVHKIANAKKLDELPDDILEVLIDERDQLFAKIKEEKGL